MRPAYVEEAARLLKKSLIHVDTEKIVLNDGSHSAPHHREVSSDSSSDLATGSNGTHKHVQKSIEPNEEPSNESANAEALVVSYEEYKRISNMLVSHLRDNESSEEDGKHAQGTPLVHPLLAKRLRNRSLEA